MLCVYKRYRSFGYAVDLVRFTLLAIAKDENVKDKEETFSEARLDMVPF